VAERVRVRVRRRIRIRIRIRLRVRRRSEGDGGGPPSPSRGGGKGAKTFLLATSLAVVVVVASTPAARSAVGSGESAMSKPGTAQSKSEMSDLKTTLTQVWITGHGFRIASHLADNGNQCVNHSYGKVQEFFRQHPCVSLHRELYVLDDIRGDGRVLLAVARVEMKDADLARCLQGLLDVNGSRNITELSRERGPYKSVRYDGAVFASERDGAVVSNAQAKSVQGVPRNADLKSMVDDTLRQ
jgi:hypothetical protein